MTPNTKYEIEARAFQIMTGQMAPGKDSPSAAGPSNLELRRELWDMWQNHYAPVIIALLKAFEEMEQV